MDDFLSREVRAGPLGHYWFLTFEDKTTFLARAEACQQHIDPVYFEPTPIGGLHLTVDRIARVGASTPGQRAAIVDAARPVLHQLASFTTTIGCVTNLRGAIGFVLEPAERIYALRDLLRTATRSVLPDAAVKDSPTAPHVTIAYPKYEGLETLAATTAEGIGTPLDSVEIAVSEAVMVALERYGHSYRWNTVARLRLGTACRSQSAR
ncbi:2'-5' RNA ligase family protein [Nocardia sp. NPDC024068]|uniref:2'-5' RNA ligase family protein n=1 Tax=Nocardia sp. NPDC024068 TaxID=3157197 RepID=UPI0033C8C651